MKKCILLIGMLLVSAVSLAQYRIATVGDSNRFVFTNIETGEDKSYQQRYILGDINYLGNIIVSIAMGAGDPRPWGFSQLSGIPYTEFRDGNNSDATFASAAAVKEWFDNNTGFNSAGGSASPTDFGDEIVYLTDYSGSNQATLQTAIDELEAGDGGTIYVNKQISLGSETINISGSKPITLIGTGTFAQILCGDGSGGVVIGSEGASTSAQVNFQNIRIYGADYYGTNLEIINHRRFNAVQSSFSGNVNGVLIRSYGNGGYTYDINFTDCEIESNSGIGFYVLNEWDGAGTDDQFVTHVTYKGGYISDNGVNIKLEKEANTGEVGSIQFSTLYVDNGNTSNVNLQMIGVNNCRFNNVTFDGVTGGVDQITLDANSIYNTFTACSFEGVVSNLGGRNEFNGSPSILFFNSSRDAAYNDIGRTVRASVSGTYTIPTGLNMIQQQTIEFENPGKIITIAGAVGVTVNGVSGGSVTFGNNSAYLKATIIKQNNSDNYLVYNGAQPTPSIIAVTSSRNIASTDIFNTLACTTTSTLTITENFSSMLVGQTINLEAHGTTFTILGGSGVTLNGVSTGSKEIGDGTEYVGGVLRKTGTNSYVVF